MPLNPPVTGRAPPAPSFLPVADPTAFPASHPASTGALAIALPPGQPASSASKATIDLVPCHVWQQVAGMLPPRTRANLARVSKSMLQSLRSTVHADRLLHHARRASTPSTIAPVLRACSPGTHALPDRHRDKRQCLALAQPPISMSSRAEILTTLARSVFRLPYTTTRGQHDTAQAVLGLPASVRARPLRQLLAAAGHRTRSEADSVRAVWDEYGVSPDDLMVSVMELPASQRGPSLCAYLRLCAVPMSEAALALWIDAGRALPLEPRVDLLLTLLERVRWRSGMPAIADRHLQLLQANGELVDARQRPLSAQTALLLELVKTLECDRTNTTLGPGFQSATWPTVWNAVLDSTQALSVEDRAVVIKAMAWVANEWAPPGTADRLRAAADGLLPTDREAVAAVLRYVEGGGPSPAGPPAAISEFMAFVKAILNTTRDDAVILERYAGLPEDVQLAAQDSARVTAYRCDRNVVVWGPLAGAMLAHTTNARRHAGSLDAGLAKAWRSMMVEMREPPPEWSRIWRDIIAAALSRVEPTPRAEVLDALALKFRKIDERAWLLQQTRTLPSTLQAQVLCRLAMFDLRKWSGDRKGVQLAAKPLLEQLIAATAALPGQYQGLPLLALCELRAQPTRHAALRDVWKRFDALRWAAPPEDRRFD
ncbi:hypothetical protein [Cupriavidus gilardii]|uniref:hypothetical protein n=1 Tax=Cupriavidus gilardii TaxID=82541 RepID=UPI000ACF699E|nr:hypothetical protein [Cupriavidus gilardii]MCT9012723.1 hypothetical protein [Cupriavidus gilardii]MCT9054689.1 hypothetical protein [Cupriavidus gilardii]MCT9074730.1 hypothetical protein [Cupriavidus gilardii]QKS64515.1 hypothetical protein FOB47_22320 [Cupriavidus gilardii]WNG70988.1 hypothetical protein QWJ31_12515 [Cupriavidus gilardii]